MRKLSSPRAIVFDLGNTLWFEARRPDPVVLWRLEAAALRPLVRKWNLDLGSELETLVEDIWRAYETAWRIEEERGTHRDPRLPFIIQGALADRGVALDGDQAQDWWRAAWIPARHFGLQLYPDVIDVLRGLRFMNIKVGINTNRPCTGDMLWPDLHDIGLGGLVDVVVCSGDTGFVKPHPSTFERVTAMLELRADEIVMVGDLCANDCAGAKAVGMTTVLKLNGRHDVKPCPDADYTIHDLGELLLLPLFGEANRRPAVESLTPHDDENADRY